MYLRIETNVTIESAQRSIFLANASSSLANILGKPESYAMVALHDNTPMLFDGSEQPTAFLVLKTVRLSTTRTSEYSSKLCAFIQDSLNIPKRESVH